MSYIEAALKNIYFKEDRCSWKCVGITKPIDLMDRCMDKHFCHVFNVYGSEKSIPIPSLPHMNYSAYFRCKECIEKYGTNSL